MAKVTLSTIKNWFRTGLKPTQFQFWDSWDSFWHKDEQIPIEQISDIADLLAAKADTEALANHKISAEAHSELFDAKVDKVAGFELSENNLTDELLAKINASNSLSGSRIIRGGFAILPNRIIRLFIYEYLIADKYYDTPVLADVQLDVGGAEDRADTVAINNLSQAVVKKGIEGDPSPPDVDIATELFITWRLMKAGATEPEGSTATVMYDENLGQAGGEWDASTNDATINLDGNSNPSSGAKSITITDNNNYDVFHLLNSAPVAIDSDGALQLTVNLQNEWIGNYRIWVLLYNGAARIHTNFIAIKDGMYGLDGALLNTQQEIAIPFKDYNLTSDSYNMVQFFFLAKGKTLSVDNIRAFDATGQPDTGETSQVISRTSQIPINDGLNGDSFYVEDKNLGAAAKSNNYADLDGLPILEPYPKITFNELIPDSHLPDSTGDIQIIGNALTEEMCLAENLNKTEAELQSVKGLTIEGQTINHANFINSHLILANATLGAVEDDFAVMGNNGAGFVKKDNAILVVLGEVFSPTSTDWVDLSLSEPDISIEGKVSLTTWAATQSAKWIKPLDHTKNYSLRFNMKRSPLGQFPISPRPNVFEVIKPDGTVLFGAQFQLEGTTLENMYVQTTLNGLGQYKTDGTSATTYEERLSWLEMMKPRFDFTNGVMKFYLNGNLRGVYSDVIAEDLYVRIKVQYVDIENIKYIKLAT